MNHCVKKFWNNLLIQRDLNFIVPKRELNGVLLYLGKTLFDLRKKFRRTIEGKLPYCKLKVIFRSKCTLNNLFRSKIDFRKNPFWNDLSL